MDFGLRSDIGHGKSQAVVGNRVQGVSGFAPLIPSGNVREYHPGTQINKSMLKQKRTLIFLHIGNSNSSMLNLLNKMDQKKQNSENRFIVQCTLCIFTNKRSANKFSLLFVKKRSLIVLTRLQIQSCGSYYVLLRHFQHVGCEDGKQNFSYLQEFKGCVNAQVLTDNPRTNSNGLFQALGCRGAARKLAHEKKGEGAGGGEAPRTKPLSFISLPILFAQCTILPKRVEEASTQVSVKYG